MALPPLTEFVPAAYSILIVDDNPTNLGVLVDYMKEYGFTILTARDGETGIKRAHYAKPDLILLDVMMPGIDGFETCRRLKAAPETAAIPIIFMTALVEPEDKVRGFEAGGVDYITKPIQQAEVMARVTTHLRLQGLTRSLQDKNRQLAELNASKDKFLAIMAHDLRSPFTPLLTFSQLLAERAELLPPAQLKQMSAAIHTSAQSMHNLLENLLAWSLLQCGILVHEPGTISLRPEVAHSMELLAEVATSKGIVIDNQVPPDLQVYADHQMLNTVIRNLISNALKFTPPGGRVIISATTSPDGLVEVAVQDTGVGINPADLPKLFRLDIKHTTTGTDQEPGTGLGLLLCQEMVTRNGGQISVESQPAQGTTFRFTLPPPTGSPPL